MIIRISGQLYCRAACGHAVTGCVIVDDDNVFNDLSDFMGKKVLYYANLTNSFEYEKELEIVTFMEVTLENGEKVTQKFTDKVEIDGYGGF